MAQTKFSLKTFSRNVGSGWVAMLVSGLVGFVTLPLSMRYLGKELYGVSALMVAFLSIFQFLSFGLPPTILRFFSLAYAKKDDVEAKQTLFVSLTLLGGLGTVGTIGILACFPRFLSVYSIPQEWRNDVLFLFIVTAFHFFQTFVLIPYYALIQAKNRFDLANYRRVLASLIRLTTLWLGYAFLAPTLRVLAYSSICGIVYELVSVLWIAWRLEGLNIIPSRKYWSGSIAKKMFSFSVDNLINATFFSLSIQLPILIIGKTLGKESVAYFTPAVTISGLCASVLGSFGSPLTPLASADKINNDGGSIGRWAIILGETVALVGCLIVVGCSVMGRDFLTLWLGESFVWTTPTVVLMVFGIVYAAIQAVNYSLALGSSTIKPVAYSSVVMALLTALGTYIGTAYYGWSILGVAICIAVVRILRNTFFLAGVYSRLFHYNYPRYFWRVYFKPTVLACFVIFLGFWARKVLPDYEPNYFTLIFGSFVVAFLYGILGWYFVLSDEIKKRVPYLNRAPRLVRKLLGVKS